MTARISLRFQNSGLIFAKSSDKSVGVTGNANPNRCKLTFL